MHGYHAPVAGGLVKALNAARDYECNAVQIFSRNPRGWTAKELCDAECESFKTARVESGIEVVAVHANYLINLAATDEIIALKSRAAFREEALRSIALGADYLVVHPGSAKGAGETVGVANCAANLRAACDGIEFGEFRILIENTAGQGACIGHRFEHLRDILAACQALNLGVCFDTAHAFAAGYDLRDADGVAATFDALESCVGLKNVRVAHFNDSKTAYNSRVDRHENLGAGQIGADGLRAVAASSRLAHAAFVLETPQEPPGAIAADLARLRGFFDDKINAERKRKRAVASS